MRAAQKQYKKYLSNYLIKAIFIRVPVSLTGVRYVKTSISDAEVEHEEQDGFFWHINYPVIGEEGRFVEIATTRPETLLGDTAVAVNPDDERYQDTDR